MEDSSAAPTIPDLAKPPDKPAASQLGISLAALRRLREYLAEKFEGFDTMTTRKLKDEWVLEVTTVRDPSTKDVTAGKRLLELELPGLVEAADVGPPMYFISHAWANPFSRLLDHVLGFLQNASEVDTRVWIDLLAVNQHYGTEEAKEDVSSATFDAAIATCSGGTVVVMDRTNGNPATRAWCIFEWASTLTTRNTDGLHIQLSEDDRIEVYDSINVQQAGCFIDADREMIRRRVVEQYGSYEAFDARLKLHLLLQPLSYRADIRNLLKGAAGDGAGQIDVAAALEGQLTWAPIEEWLWGKPGGVQSSPAAQHSRKWQQPLSDDGEAGCTRTQRLDGGGQSAAAAEVRASDCSSSRVLVITAGAGEGKSTISAALAQRFGAPADAAATAGPSVRGCADSARTPVVLAYHFLKYNDARKLDAVRIVQSLAFQLALRLPTVQSALLSAGSEGMSWDLNEDGDDLGTMDSAFKLLLLHPLTAAARAGELGERQVVLLLDALDEADPPEEQLAATGRAPACPTIRGNKALQLLVKHLARLPDCVRFVVTTRPEAASGQVLPCLERTFGCQQRGGEGGGGGLTVLPASSLLKDAAAEKGRGGDGSGDCSGGGASIGGSGGGACGQEDSSAGTGGGDTRSGTRGGVLLYQAVSPQPSRRWTAGPKLLRRSL